MIKLVTAAGAGAVASTLAQTAAAQADPPARPFRVVHLTDMHVTADRHGDEGFAAALRAVAKLSPAPQFIITGGDHVMEAFDASREQADVQWDLYARTLAAGTRLPTYPVLGNHDIWGWGAPDKIAENQPGYGKALAMDRLGLKSRYYSFDAGGWHFVMLDSMTRRGKSYLGQIDDAQLEWLRGDLAAAAPKPICVVSHIPVLSACVFFDGDRLRPDFWHVPDAWMHRDAKPLLEILRVAGVKLAISGHIHLLDHVQYNGIHFICDGAVCGNWWKGSYHETPAGFGVLDLHADGRFEHQYVDFGWKPKVEPG